MMWARQNIHIRTIVAETTSVPNRVRHELWQTYGMIFQPRPELRGADLEWQSVDIEWQSAFVAEVCSFCDSSSSGETCAQEGQNI